MANLSLPPKILDNIVDFVRDCPEALRECCLVARSWVPRTRAYLFARVHFNSFQDLRSWESTFPDPFNSPAFYTHTLLFFCCSADMVEAVARSHCIKTFSNVVQLELWILASSHETQMFLPTFYGFAPGLKYLCIDSSCLPLLQVFTLVRSFPNIETLSLTSRGLLLGNDYDPQIGWVQPVEHSILPTSLGYLKLEIPEQVGVVIIRLLEIRNGIHLKRLFVRCASNNDLEWTEEFLLKSCNALESLSVECLFPGMRFLPSPRTRN